MRQIRMPCLTRRELETWPGWNCEPTVQSKERGWKPSAYRARASSRPYRRAGVRNQRWQHRQGADARPLPYIPTWAGFLYVAVVLDAFSRKIVGWAMETHLRTELVLAALNMALGQRRPAEVIHHSDHGSQYTAFAFGKRCDEAGVRPSMGSVGDCFDNAMCESFFATLECELLDRTSFKNQAEARTAVFDFIEGWYNPHRRHSALDYLSPIDYERAYAAQPVSRSSDQTEKGPAPPPLAAGKIGEEQQAINPSFARTISQSITKPDTVY